MFSKCPKQCTGDDVITLTVSSVVSVSDGGRFIWVEKITMPLVGVLLGRF